MTDPIKILVFFALMLLLSACSAFDPYVFRPSEFDRQSVTFNTEPTDITEVRICYQGLLTGQESIVALAEERCRQFDRTAEYISTRYGQCPLLTAAQARFACTRP